MAKLGEDGKLKSLK